MAIIPAYRSGKYFLYFFFVYFLHRLRVNISFEVVFIKLMLTWGYFYENKLHIYYQLVLLQVNSFGILHFGITLRIHSCAKSVSTFSIFPIYILLITRLTFRRFSVVILCLILQKIIVTKRRFNLPCLTCIEIIFWQLIWKICISSTTGRFFKEFCYLIYPLQNVSRKILL